MPAGGPPRQREAGDIDGAQWTARGEAYAFQGQAKVSDAEWIVRGVTAAITVGLVLGGCAAATGPVGYPADWASIKSTPTADGCPSLAGKYSNHSDATVPATTAAPPKLSDVFTRITHGVNIGGPAQPWQTLPDDPVSVAIALAPEALQVTFADAAGGSGSLAFRRYHFRWSEEHYADIFNCYLTASEPRLGFLSNPESHGGASPIGFGGGGTVVLLLKAVDGSLVVQWRRDSLSLWLGVVGSGVKLDSTWHRYPSLTETRPDPR
jgi:hypothetical protein